jgi:glycosyltransferase involved in cell wall biosynthesis
LRSVIKIIRPKVLHIQELQHGGYLLNDKILDNQKVVLACSTWGSDLIFYGKLQSHKQRLEKLLSRTDFLLTERQVDLKIAQELGFHGKSISPAYVTVGSDVFEKNWVSPSLRTKIVVKGYQDNHGRALNALQALTLIPNAISDFTVVVISSSEAVRVYVEFLNSIHNMNIVCAPKMSHSEIMNLFAESRLYIGLSMSDGISNTMIESMQNGAFPIQSLNSCAPEFIQHGISGFVVDPWDISEIATLIETSLRDNRLVDNAVELNLATVREKFSREKGLEILESLYNGILNDR